MSEENAEKKEEINKEEKQETEAKTETKTETNQNTEEKTENKEEQKQDEQKEKPKKVMDFLAQRDAKHVEAYSQAVIQKFGKYIKSIVVWGSQKEGVGKRKTSDIDIAIIVDDTDVQKLTRPQLKEKLFQRLCEMSYPISAKIHPQPYLLTEFWEYVRESNPVFYNILRNGVTLYDTGFFLPVQMLMKMGGIKPTREAIDKHIFVSKELLRVSGETILHKLTFNLENAVVGAAQAVLMEIGYRPPAPNEVSRFVQEFLVEKEKLTTKEYSDIAMRVIKTYKDIEHKEKKEITGKEFDEIYKLTEKFVNEMIKILKSLRKKKGEKIVHEEIAEKKKQEEVKRDGIRKEESGEEFQEKADELIKQQMGQK